MEVPNNAKPEEIMNFKKFSQSVKYLIYSEEEVWIEGKFKEVGSDKIHSGDGFWAKKIHNSGKKINAKEIYKTYIEWFNRTLRPGEDERVFVSAKMVEKHSQLSQEKSR